MGYLRLKYNSRLIFDPTYPLIDDSTFQHHDWEEFYGDVQEAIPTNAPPPLGKEVDLRMMADSDHAGDKMTRQSRTGFPIFLNMPLINWLSQKQPTIESSVFGAELVAMKLVELYPICLLTVWPVSVSYRRLPVGIFGMVCTVFFVL
jgi:hypothetical protein